MGKSRPELPKSPRHKNPSAISKTFAKPKTASLGTAANIKVVVRVRPFNAKEESDNHKNVIRKVDDEMLIFDPKDNAQPFFYHGVQQKGRDLLKKANKDLQFVFDKVYGFEATNDDIFKDTTKNLIKSLMDGYNCSVFAYGATGAGKTYTMLGSTENPGITYRTMEELFNVKQELSAERKFELGITYLEVYNELVQDLLNPGAPLQLREDGKYGVTVAGIKMHKIENPGDLFKLLEQGNSNRTQHPTDANAESSRSHAVFQVYIQMQIKATREVRAAKLSMIDLAGSERGSATGFVGARFTEGANINKSLLALGNCINSLADGQRHVPYRDSKLTRLLKDSLGGNCQTVMVANISPSSLSYEDTYNTLRYATRAKKIKSNMKRNVVNMELRAGEYAKIVEDLKSELEKVKGQLKQKLSCENAEEPTVNEDVSNELLKLFDERKKLSERMFNVECSETIVGLRRKLKEDADSRLSGLCNETPEKEDAHRRLGNTVGRFYRQEDTLKSELSEIKLAKVELENKTVELVKQHPELEPIAELEGAKLSNVESQYQSELLQKKYSLMEEELKSKGCLLGNVCKMLQTCYLQLKGHGFATDNMVQEYQGLVRHLQGYKSITWCSPVEAELASSISSNVLSNDAENRPSKRKIGEENLLDGTFVLDPPKPKVKVIADELMAKVYKTPLKTSAQVGINRLKENNKKAAARPLFLTKSTSQFTTSGTVSLRSKLRSKQFAIPAQKRLGTTSKTDSMVSKKRPFRT